MSESNRLDRDVERVLRERFTAPPDVGARVLARIRAEGRPGDPGASDGRGGHGGHGIGPAALFLAAAAAVVLLVHLGSRLQVAPADPARAPDSTRSPEGVARAARGGGECLLPVGPLTEGAPVELTVPNLASLYHEVRSCAGRQVACGEQDDLETTLASSHGESVRLTPEADRALYGPFSSSEWPTATVLTGYPGDATAVLIAESAATYSCCLRTELPEGCGLHVFTWQVGDLVLTEVTPLLEPRLLTLFEAGP